MQNFQGGLPEQKKRTCDIFKRNCSKVAKSQKTVLQLLRKLLSVPQDFKNNQIGQRISLQKMSKNLKELP